ncbi:LysR family transcriptional regulator [Bradyrhizobium jicamae]|uniref:LysR family transcriptional regulator n=1 Tax=Bradyrhizobium jicamae TaxID=280332 RepID=UPI001BAA17A2|nr:LysR family transcriptional regulator [Bradyrhizobium jicamae]MBR0752446.1 LysR family transcriptional regulator [Bradyrhizobium jicamae]
MFNWEDLKYFLAVAHHGSTIAAGKALGLSQSTVQRRLDELQRRLNRTLVTRQASGYRLTEFGQTMLPYAERIEAAVADFSRRAADVAQDMKGVIRVTCPEPIVARLTQSGIIERFHAAYPGLRVEFVMSDRYLDLASGEVDVAFRSGDTDDELVGRKIAESIWAVYASPDYVARHGRPERVEDLSKHLLVGLDGAFASHRAVTWLKEVAPDATMAARINSVLGIVSAVKSGVGIGPLPIALGDAEPELIRVLGPIPELTRSWRILTHPDLRRVPRIAAFFEFIAGQRDELRPILTG